MGTVPGLEQLTAEVASGTPLERVTAASELADQLRARGEELLDHFVDAARSSGSSWSEIGCSLGTTKQAAQQRFAALGEPAPGQEPFGLSGTAADVLTSGASRARDLGHRYIRPEHLVLGLLDQPEELAGQVLAELGVSTEAARARVEQRLGTAAPRPSGSLGVAPQTKRLLELAGAIAKSLGHRCPKTEHILLAATSRKLHSPAATLLADCGATAERVRDQLTRMLLLEDPELADRLRSPSLLSRIRMRNV
jgi:hypothetical protein